MSLTKKALILITLSSLSSANLQAMDTDEGEEKKSPNRTPPTVLPGGNGIPDAETIEAIARANLTSLTALDLNHNHISRQGAMALAHGFYGLNLARNQPHRP